MIPEETPPKVTKQMWCQFQPNQIKHNSNECGHKLKSAAHQVSDHQIHLPTVGVHSYLLI